MKRTLFLLFFFLSRFTFGQVHEIFVTDYLSLDYHTWEVEDTINDYSFKDWNKLNGHWVAYYDDTKKSKAIEADFKNGKLIGTEQQWYRNGVLKKESICRDTLNIDFWEFKMWNVDGTLCMKRKFENDTCSICEYYHSGNLKRKDIETKDSTGGYVYLFFVKQLCDNGQIEFTPSSFNSQEPQLIFGYNCNGMKKSEWTWRVSSFIGRYKEWYENGHLKIKGRYGKFKSFWTQTDKIGTWKYFDSFGKLIKKEKYNKGKITYLKEY